MNCIDNIRTNNISTNEKLLLYVFNYTEKYSCLLNKCDSIF